MKIRLNGKEKELGESQKLEDLIQQFCSQSPKVIAEVNGNIIKTHRWAETILKEGDIVELVTLVGGG